MRARRIAGLVPVSTIVIVALAGLASPARARAQATRTDSTAWRTEVTASWRTRAEQWDWFAPTSAGADGRYGFVGSIARLGGTVRRPGIAVTLEGAVPVLLGLPGDAVAPAPQGQLGLGAAYHVANDRERDVVQAFVKQAFVRLGAAPGARGHALRLGRFEFADGAELAPRDPTLATLKRDRIAQRLVGPFGWTHVGRSLDGAHYTHARPATAVDATGMDVTLAAALPTEGAFRARAWRPLDVGILYGAYTANAGTAARGRGAIDVRAFALHYADWRPLAPLDNRPAPVRAADTRGVRVTTVGTHALWARATPVGTVDAVAWAAQQFGDWGALSHGAGAGALEVGLQPPGLPALRPWVRLWYFRGDGDRDAADDRHGTFFEVLPTPRPYARFPFHNLMNVDQRAASLILRPGPRLTLRGDVQAIRLASATDLWYSGGGAFERGSFGYAGRPTSGRRTLATLLDASADLRLARWLGVNGYLARATAGDATRAVYPGTGPAWFGYVELDVRR
ncbi:MAG: alginate export family protein [Gemmatirosa sp.]